MFDRTFDDVAYVLATNIVAGLFFEEVLLRLASFGSHVVYLNAVLMYGNGASIAIIFILSVAQVVCGATLIAKRLYTNLGTAIPSTALGATLAVEMALYNGFRDSELTATSILTWASLFFVYLLRGGQRSRSQAMGTLLFERSLSIEAGIRFVCTKLRAARLGTACSVLLLAKAWIYDMYWTKTGALFEIHRTRFRACVAGCSVLMFLAHEDRSAKAMMMYKFEAVAQQWYGRLYMMIFKTPAPGRKKSL